MVEAKLFINGEWKDGDSFQVLNPANGKKTGTAVDGGQAETKEAIDAAHGAFPAWAALTAAERSEYLKKIYHIMMERKEELGKLVMEEMGKPIKEAVGEIGYAASFVEWYAEEGKRMYGETVPAPPNKRFMVLKQPVGVVGAITPWNFPMAMVTRKVAPALAAGCTIVLKPAEDTPLSAFKFAEICEEAGLPKGVFNLVSTSNASSVGDELLANKKVSKITFTGSTEVGKHLMKGASENVQKISLELGGHAPVIVLDDADIELAAEHTVASKFRNAGQTCVCANRVYVQESVYDEFVEKLAEKTKALKVGEGVTEDIDLGPMINKAGYEKVERHVQDAVKQGATVMTGGQGREENGGYFFEPTVLKDITHDMVIMGEETFGPVAPVQKVSTIEEAVDLANSSRYGLAAYFFTESLKRGTYVAEQLQFGIVGWNDGLPSAPQAPFGGVKESGLDREGGHQGLEAFTETKFVSIGVSQ